jgi:hypothetical protein
MNERTKYKIGRLAVGREIGEICIEIGREDGNGGRRQEGREEGTARSLQVTFFSDVADEVGESLLLDAPKHAPHHRSHGRRRRNNSPEQRRGEMSKAESKIPSGSSRAASSSSINMGPVPAPAQRYLLMGWVSSRLSREKTVDLYVSLRFMRDNQSNGHGSSSPVIVMENP